MIALLALIIGIPLALRLDRGGNWPLLVGEGLLFGLGACGGILFLLAVAGVAWTRVSFAIVYGACLLVAWSRSRVVAGWAGPRHLATPRPLDALLLIATAILLTGYALFATLTTPAEFDFLADWGAKGRVFFEARTIDWHFLETASYRATHPDYPPLLPLIFDAMAVVRGAWIDTHLGIVNVIFAAALLLIVYGVTRSAFIVFAVVPLAALPWLGIADGPFAACATAALLLLRDDDHGAAGAVMLGLAAMLKNEGLALIAAVALARPKRAWRLWPAVVIAAPWLILRAMHHLTTDVTAGGLVQRVVQHLGDPEVFLLLVRYPLGKPLFWIGLLLALVVSGRELLRRERFLLAALGFQLLFYIAAYLATPHDVRWHVRWSWERLVAHLLPALIVVAMLHTLDKWRTCTNVVVQEDFAVDPDRSRP